MATLPIFRQGETIKFTSTANGVDLDSNEFTAVIYLDSCKNRVVIPKSEFTRISPNTYSGKIENTVSAKLAKGTYRLEYLIGTVETAIPQGDAFILQESEAKKEL